MATPGLSAVSSDTPEDRQDSSGVAVQPKYTKSASGALIPTASTVLSSPEEQGSILENMKNYVKQREAQQNSLLTALNLASIYGSGGAEGPWRALQAQQQQEDKQAAELFNMRQAIAQQKGAQELQQQFIKSNQAQGWLGAPAQGTDGGVQAGGGSNFIPDYMSKQFLDIAKTEGITAANKFKSQYLQDQAKQETTFLNTKASYDRDIGILNENGQYELINAIEARDRIKKGNAKLATVSPPTKDVTSSPISVDQLHQVVVKQESGGRKDVPTSAAGAVGPSQITPDTWKTYVDKGVIPKEFKIDNAENNLEASKLILGDLMKKHKNDYEKALAEYYGGPGAIDQYGNIKREVKPKEGVPGPTVGGYIDQVKARIDSMPTTKTAPSTFAEAKQTYEVEKSYQEAYGKEDIAKRKDFETESDPITTGRLIKQNQRMMDIVEKNPSVVGVFADPGIKNAVLSYMQGRQDMSREDLEDVIFKASAESTTDMNQRREVSRYLAEMAIRSRQMLKGQGQISDYEQRVIDRMAGSIKDPAELLYKTAKLVQARDKYLMAARELYDKQQWKRFSDFNKSEQAKALRNSYFDEVDSIYSSEPNFAAARIKRKSEPTSQEKAVRDIIAKQNKTKSE